MAKSKIEQRVIDLENEVLILKQLVHSLTNKVNEKRPKFWWEGGTLHDVTMEHWNMASLDNRLASSADYIHAFMKIDDYEHMIDYSNNPNILLTAYASPLMECINQIGLDPEMNDFPMSWVASAAAFQLGFVKVNAVMREAQTAKENQIVKRVAALIQKEGITIDA